MSDVEQDDHRPPRRTRAGSEAEGPTEAARSRVASPVFGRPDPVENLADRLHNTWGPYASSSQPARPQPGLSRRVRPEKDFEEDWENPHPDPTPVPVPGLMSSRWADAPSSICRPTEAPTFLGVGTLLPPVAVPVNAGTQSWQTFTPRNPAPNPQVHPQWNQFQAFLAAQQQGQPPQGPAPFVPHAIPAPVAPDAPGPAVAAIQNKKAKEPDSYTGKKRGQEAAKFLLQCRLYFHLRPAMFPADTDRVGFAISYLSDIAESWAQPLLEDLVGPQVFTESTNWAAFAAEFEAAFGEADREGAAARELDKLKQTKSATEYSADFRHIVANLPTWDMRALMHSYWKGLKDSVKDVLVNNLQPPTTLNEFMAIAIRIDDQLYERRLEKAGSSAHHPPPRPNHPRPNPPPRAPTSAPPPVVTDTRTYIPMDLSAARRGPVTTQEKECRRQENLCFYCRADGHKADFHKEVQDCRAKVQGVVDDREEEEDVAPTTQKLPKEVHFQVNA
jgi:hypothetical protein